MKEESKNSEMKEVKFTFGKALKNIAEQYTYKIKTDKDKIKIISFQSKNHKIETILNLGLQHIQ